jgi:hypothetical protein
MLDLVLSDFIMKKLNFTIFLTLFFECVFTLLVTGRCCYYCVTLLCFLFNFSVTNMSVWFCMGVNPRLSR